MRPLAIGLYDQSCAPLNQDCFTLIEKHWYVLSQSGPYMDKRSALDPLIEGWAYVPVPRSYEYARDALYEISQAPVPVVSPTNPGKALKAKPRPPRLGNILTFQLIEMRGVT